MNGLLGPQAEKIYPSGHGNFVTAQSINQVHGEAAQHFKDFSMNHKATCDQFRVYFAKFDVIFAKLRQRDKSLDTFKHYFEKLRKMKEDKSVRSSVALDPARLAKEEEKL